MKKIKLISLICCIFVILAGCSSGNTKDIQIAAQNIITSDVYGELVSSGFTANVKAGLTASDKIEKNVYEIRGMYNGTLNSGDDATGDFSFTITYDPKTKTATRTSDVVYTGTMVELKEQAVYTNKYEKIKELALTSEAVCGTVYDIWNIVGAEEVIGCLQYMMNIPEDFDTFWNNEASSHERWWECKIGDEYGWLNNSSFGISFDKDAREFHEMCLNFQENYAKVESLNDEISSDIKNMRGTYAVEHEEEFELLNEFFIETSAFADFSLNPSGSLNSYINTYNEYEQSIQKCMKAADIY